MMRKNIWTISQLVGYIKNELSNNIALKNISIQGEIGNFTNHYSGHWYFTLKDKDALINCAMFKGYNQHCLFIPKNGDKLIVTGSINVFEKQGQLQLIVTAMKEDGIGNFYIQFEKIKRKLEPLGYFDVKHKKTIPQFPNEIAIITGANTAALQDILTTIYNRWPLAKTTEIHALVQGQKAIESIVSAIKKANNTSADIIILARGGGSIDDLWCFNDESIAKAIFESQKPVITGIGHETDFTIADLVADFRAATPTAAAAKATPDYREILNIINKCENIIVQTISNDLNKYNQLLDFHKNRLENYRNSIIKYKVEIDNLLNIALLNLKKKSELFKQNISNRKMIIELSLKSLIKYNSDYLENIAAMLIKSIDDKLHKCKINLSKSIDLLDSYSPLKTLQRGYVISSQDNIILKSIKDIDYSKNIETRFIDGIITSKPVKE
ncbi:MAG: exodeoxyribonuclease VII large subunit [Bacillota bacterium]|jgi:exodeoxyribonuclease VII large subunit|nr:exodeoxyribonuclease VII large subunit [Bacillota bacterium]NLL25848.1 exodeoxyribonuclease VII large subunit [Erysipelotrichia bacterium]